MDNNLYVFLDTEFTSLSRSSKLISVGCVVLSHKRESFYAEFNDYSEYMLTDFVKENVVNNLLYNEKNEHAESSNNKFFMKNHSKKIKEELTDWLDYLQSFYKKQIVFVLDVGSYDWFLITELLRDEEIFEETGSNILPQYISYIPIDISTMLYVAGFDPDVNRDQFLNLNKDDIKNHNALIDAKKIHIMYAMLMNKFFPTKLNMEEK